MPKVVGVFEIFHDLDKIPTEEILKWIIPPPPLHIVENYLANRILYPQVAPVTVSDLSIDLAILREMLKQNNSFYRPTEHKIIIPTNFVEFFANLSRLVWSFVDAYKPTGIVQIAIEKEGMEEIIGTVLIPLFEERGAKFELSVEDKQYSIRNGTLTIIPCSKNRCHLLFKSNRATVLGKKESVFEAYGGRLGIMVDAR